MKPFVQGNKNDKNDARAIVIAAQQDNRPTVPIKTIEQQEVQMLHRYRESLTHERTALGNRIRGYLREVGLFLVQGLSQESIYVAWLLATRIYQRRQRLSGFCNNKEAILCGASSQGKAKTSGSITDETKLGAVRIFLCWH